MRNIVAGSFPVRDYKLPFFSSQTWKKQPIKCAICIVLQGELHWFYASKSWKAPLYMKLFVAPERAKENLVSSQQVMKTTSKKM